MVALNEWVIRDVCEGAVMGLRTVLPEIEQLTRAELGRVYLDDGYPGYRLVSRYERRGFIASQKREVPSIRWEFWW